MTTNHPAEDRAAILARGTESWRKRVENEQVLHGLGPSTYLPGNVCHLVSPIVGMLRLMERDGESPDAGDVAFVIDRLSFVLELAREEAEKNRRDSTGEKT